MDELRQALSAAASDPPPTGIDLDHIIDSTRQRGRLNYRAGMAVGLTVAAAGAVLVPAVLTGTSGGLGAGGPGGGSSGTCEPYWPGPGTPWPSVVPNPVIPSSSMGVVDGPSVAPSEPTASRGAEPAGPPDVYPPVKCVGLAKPCPELVATAGPEPSRPADRPAGTREDCAAAVLRLSSAVAGAMRDAMPGWGVTDSVDPGNPNTRWVFLRQAGDAVEDGYVAALGVAKGDQISHLNVTLSVGNRQDATAGCAGRQLKPEETCRVTARGDVLITSVQKLAVAPLPGSSVPPGHEMPTFYTVTDIRPDGTRVVVSGRSPLTTGQLEALAQAPGLTLFP